MRTNTPLIDFGPSDCDGRCMWCQDQGGGVEYCSAACIFLSSFLFFLFASLTQAWPHRSALVHPPPCWSPLSYPPCSPPPTLSLGPSLLSCTWPHPHPTFCRKTVLIPLFPPGLISHPRWGHFTLGLNPVPPASRPLTHLRAWSG